MNKRIGLYAVVFASLFLLLIASVSRAEKGKDIVILINADSPLAVKLTAKQIKSIYMGETQSVKGTKVVPLNLQDSEAFGVFAEQYLGMSINAYKSFWIKKMLSEGGNAPKMLESAGDMLRGVSESKGAIGYLWLGDFQAKADKAKEMGVVQAHVAKAGE